MATDKSKEALKLALEALEYIEHNYMSLPAPAEKAITALREALAEQPAQTATYTCGVCGVSMQMEQPAQQTIHCKHRRKNNGVCPHHNLQCGWPKCNEPEQPTQRTWVALTDEDYRELHLEMGPTYFYQDYGRAIEAKLKEKNQ